MMTKIITMCYEGYRKGVFVCEHVHAHTKEGVLEEIIPNWVLMDL